MLGLDFTSETPEELLSRMLHEPVPTDAPPRAIVTANIDHVGNLMSNAAFRIAYKDAWRRTIDGAPVHWWCRARGLIVHRIPGADLFRDFMDRADPALHRLFFVVPRAEVGSALETLLVSRGFTADQIGWHCPPMGFEKTPDTNQALLDALKAHTPSHIFFGVGAPRSEIWIQQHASALPPAYVLACGASLEFYVGHKKRAPEWMRRVGLEWSWRLFSEPKRLAHRYLVNGWRFLAAIWRDLRGHRLLDDA